MDKDTGSTKREILELLKQNKQLTITELARELGITEMAVRRHVSKLEKDELIESTLVRQQIGRPTYVYHLSANGEDIFPKQYKEFALEMLEDLQLLGEERLISNLLQARTERMKYRLQKRLLSKATTSARLREIELVQKQQGYMTSIERQLDGSFLLTKQNCPLLSIARQHPSLCEIEEKMYQDLLPDAEITAVACASDGECACIYKITPKL